MATEQQKIYQIKDAPIISVKEARKIMGIVANSYDDRKVESIIEALLEVAKIAGQEAYTRVTKESVPKYP